MTRRITQLVTAACTGLVVGATPAAFAEGNQRYQVTVTNLTHSINFTPILVSSHRGAISIFEPGAAASAEMVRIAEGGDIAPMAGLLQQNPRVRDVQNSDGLLGPGQSVTVTVSARKGANRISLASMMLPTNDGFIGLNNVLAPRHGSAVYHSPGYDAGSETNDELCVSIPGPTCGGEPFSPNDDGEGFIHVHRGMHDVGDLAAHTYDWRNPVARIEITRTR